MHQENRSYSASGIWRRELGSHSNGPENRSIGSGGESESPHSNPTTPSPSVQSHQEKARELLGPSFWKGYTAKSSESLFSHDELKASSVAELADEDSSDISKLPALKLLLESRSNIPDSSDYAVIKLSNIPWDTTQQEIREFFEPHAIPRHHLPPHYMEGIHLILNRDTGRTLNECFIEFPDSDVARDVVQDKGKRRQVLNGKYVRVELSSQRELRMALFPKFFVEREKPGIQSGAVYLSREEISFLLNQCRGMRYQSPRRSKAIERPIENIISVISKVPWHDEEGISTLFRDHLFEMLKCK
jgi:RNA recognition motif-containing protein